MKRIKPKKKEKTLCPLAISNVELFSNLDEASQASFSGGKYIPRKPKEIVVVGGPAIPIRNLLAHELTHVVQ